MAEQTIENKVGLLWRDDTAGRTVVDKVAIAARRFSEKYGGSPQMCYVHPATFEVWQKERTQAGDAEQAAAAASPQLPPAGYEIAPLRHIMPDYFWLVEVSHAAAPAEAEPGQ